MTVNETGRDFNFSIFRINCVFRSAGDLNPAYFVRIFSRYFQDIYKSKICGTPSLDCGFCQGRNDCPYAILYNPEHTEDIAGIQIIDDASVPFTIRPFFERGNEVSFDLVMAGKSARAFPAMVATFRRMGFRGCGTEDLYFSVESCASLDSRFRPVSDEVDPAKSESLVGLHPIGVEEALSDAPQGPMGRISVHFITPPLLKDTQQGDVPKFKLLVRRLRDRLRVIGTIYCGAEPDLKMKGLAMEAGDIKTASVRRSSARTSVLYEGPLVNFVPLLKLGTFFNVGRSCAYGQGRFEI